MEKKIGRNDKCPCGSGKKYKYCCMDKLSVEEIETLYLQQLQLAHKLNDEESCYRVLEMGEKILSAGIENRCITGTYVNMALAKRILYYKKNNMNDLLQAEVYYKEALRLKPHNQAAIRHGFGICLQLKKYSEAKKLLETYDADINFKNPVSVQIVQEYQAAIGRADSEEYNETVKNTLDKITELLFEKFGKNAGLESVAMMYYCGIGNDILRAYELARRSIEKYKCYETYCNLGWLCLHAEINRPKDAEMYYTEAIKLCSNKETQRRIQGNYMIALAENGKLEEAANLGHKLVTEDPCNQNYSNYAEVLKRKGDLAEALKWGRRALFIIEDDTTLLIVADIYRLLCDYENAEEMYIRCIDNISEKNNIYQFQDADGVNLYSMASNESIDEILYEAFCGMIKINNSQKKFDLAKTYAIIGKEKFPRKKDWEIWIEAFKEIESTTEQYEKIKGELDQKILENKNQRHSFRLWAQQLIQLQNNSGGLDLDDNDAWERYEESMNQVLVEMSKIINKESDVYQQKINWINMIFSNLDLDSKEFLITAEVLFELHKTSIIDFAPIIVEYCKVVEKQLRIKLGSQLPVNAKMLGQIIGYISRNSIAPYNVYLQDLIAVNDMRKKSAHTGVLTKQDVISIRNIFYQNNLLANLM